MHALLWDQLLKYRYTVEWYEYYPGHYAMGKVIIYAAYFYWWECGNYSQNILTMFSGSTKIKHFYKLGIGGRLQKENKKKQAGAELCQAQAQLG